MSIPPNTGILFHFNGNDISPSHDAQSRIDDAITFRMAPAASRKLGSTSIPIAGIHAQQASVGSGLEHPSNFVQSPSFLRPHVKSVRYNLPAFGPAAEGPYLNNDETLGSPSPTAMTQWPRIVAPSKGYATPGSYHTSSVVRGSTG
ncbi:hypothetical protein K438DRAFT_1764280 [Mycena galopus ATCC 62051]|nr:hypothetical protein K438DRAFT_1764280 [Mycena galopus ATCC 62051]